MLLERYCICGDVLMVNLPRRKKTQAFAVWYNHHSGDGHGDTDAAGAEMVRMGTYQPIGREAMRARLGGSGEWRIARYAIGGSDADQTTT